MASKRRTSSAARGRRPVRARGRTKVTRPATPRQTALLTFIRDYMHKHGYSPTLDEIAAEFDISKVTVFEHLTTLEDRGLVRREKHKARSLELSPHLELPDERPGRLRLLGRIAAGSPIEAIEQPEVVDLDEMFTSRHDTYVLEVQGDSMIDDHITDGDLVVVEQRTNPVNGETVVALLNNGEATLKRFYREKGRIRLQPANPAYPPIFLPDVRVQGVVIGVVRRTR